MNIASQIGRLKEMAKPLSGGYTVETTSREMADLFRQIASVETVYKITVSPELAAREQELIDQLAGATGDPQETAKLKSKLEEALRVLNS